jgi:pimeloyl-ACP methyl ester carboxylesterase
MINDFLSTMSLWDPALIDQLASKHQLILFDNRGAGLSSDTAQNNTTIPQMADDVVGLIRSVDFQKVSTPGDSMGSRIAQQLLIHHPKLVHKAILYAADPGGTQQA